MAYKYLLWAELDLLIVRFNGKKNDFTPKLLFTFHIVLFLELGCKPPEGMDFPWSHMFLDNLTYRKSLIGVWVAHDGGLLGTAFYPTQHHWVWISRSLIINPGAYHQVIKPNESLPTSRLHVGEAWLLLYGRTSWGPAPVISAGERHYKSFLSPGSSNCSQVGVRLGASEHLTSLGRKHKDPSLLLTHNPPSQHCPSLILVKARAWHRGHDYPYPQPHLWVSQLFCISFDCPAKTIQNKTKHLCRGSLIRVPTPWPRETLNLVCFSLCLTS